MGGLAAKFEFGVPVMKEVKMGDKDSPKMTNGKAQEGANKNLAGHVDAEVNARETNGKGKEEPKEGEAGEEGDKKREEGEGKGGVHGGEREGAFAGEGDDFEEFVWAGFLEEEFDEVGDEKRKEERKSEDDEPATKARRIKKGVNKERKEDENEAKGGKPNYLGIKKREAAVNDRKEDGFIMSKGKKGEEKKKGKEKKEGGGEE